MTGLLWRAGTVVPAALVGAALLVSGPALAHEAVLGITGYPVLVLHPIIVLDHAFCLMAASILSGLQDNPKLMRVLAALVTGLVTGFACLVLLPGFQGDVFLPLIGTVVIGILAAAAPRLNRWAAAGIVAAAGFVVGLNTYPADGLPFILAMTLGGLVIGAAILVLGLTWLVSRAKKKWQRTAARIAASWVAASGLLVLALMLAG